MGDQSAGCSDQFEVERIKGPRDKNEMKFNEQDLSDPRVLRPPSGWHEYPQEVPTAPMGPGVYLLADNDDNILYVGSTSFDGLRLEMMGRVGHISDSGAVKLRCAATRDHAVGRQLAAEWVKKYAPRNNLEL
jgi:hypothetical protein